MIKKIFEKLGGSLPFSQTHVKAPFDIQQAEKTIGYTFKDKNHLIQAFTHRSYLNRHSKQFNQSNERLEFLGDAVLDIIVTEYLYFRFPQEAEGMLSTKKSVLVSRRVLGDLVEHIGLGKFLLIDRGEEKTGGRNRTSNLANLFEAILGAIYLDGGFIPAKKFVEQFLFPRADSYLSKSTFFNYKSALLEYAQSKGWGPPRYRIIKEYGPDHDKRFIVSVHVNNGTLSAKGTGRSKKKAEQKAAQSAMHKLKQLPAPAQERRSPSRKRKKQAV